MGIIDDIKKSATTSGTVIQSTEATELSGIFNKMFYLPKTPKKEVQFIKQMMTRGQETEERKGLHASALIVSDEKFCLRQQILSLLYKQLQGEQIPVNLKRIFEEGNAVHEKWQRLFLRAGYCEPTDLDYTMFNKKYRISFTPDAIIEVPSFYSGKMVGEIKSVNTMQFKKMAKHPSASKQLQLYMYLSGIKKGFVLNDDKNDQNFKIEVYDLDMEKVKPYIKRAEAVKAGYKRFKQTGKMEARPKDATSSECKRCSSCAMRNACFNIGEGRMPL